MSLVSYNQWLKQKGFCKIGLIGNKMGIRPVSNNESLWMPKMLIWLYSLDFREF